jgi:hypothetical protein
MNLVEMLEAANRPRPAMPLAPTRQAKPDERAWQLEWARRNREISARLKAAQAASNDARVLATMQRRSGVWTTRDLAHVLRVNADWLRKHPLRRLCEAGKVDAVIVRHEKTGWPIRRDWIVRASAEITGRASGPG